MASKGDTLGRAANGDTSDSPFVPSGGPQQALSISELLRGPGIVYMQLNDRLLVRAFNQTAVAQSLLVTARAMRLDGQVVVLPYTMAVPANAVTPATFDLAEGYLLDLVVGANGAGFPRGSVFVQAGLARGNAAAATQGNLLISGYPAGTQVLGWPQSTMQNGTDGAGLLVSQSVANPAAGADWVFTIPAGMRAKFRGANFAFTTNATAATRDVVLRISDGAQNIIQAPASATQAASLGFAYLVGNYPFVSTTLASAVQIGMPDNLMLAAGWTINTFTSNIQAGDQHSSIKLMLETWVDNE